MEAYLEALLNPNCRKEKNKSISILSLNYPNRDIEVIHDVSVRSKKNNKKIEHEIKVSYQAIEIVHTT